MGAAAVAPFRPYRIFRVRVERVEELGPHFVRVHLGGGGDDGADQDSLAHFADHGFDVRIKLIFPLEHGPDSGLEDFPTDGDWYRDWRERPDARRNPIRTYTVRAMSGRGADRRLLVDLVRHGDAGPASRWIGRAAVGDQLLVVGPDARADDSAGGLAWRPHPAARQLLLGGDETAVPAVAAILERLPATAAGTAVLEVPDRRDIQDLAAPAGMSVRWHVRGLGHGSAWEAGVRQAVGELLATGGDAGPGGGALPVAAEDPGPESGEALWDVPTAPGSSSPLYAWLAGETGTVVRLRRHLVSDLGIDRRAVAFMGYWRSGRPEN